MLKFNKIKVLEKLLRYQYFLTFILSTYIHKFSCFPPLNKSTSVCVRVCVCVCVCACTCCGCHNI